MPRQLQLPSIQEIFGESHPLTFPSRPSYEQPSNPRHAALPALPAVYGIDRSNEGAPSTEQRLLFKNSTAGRTLGHISPFDGIQPSETTDPAYSTSRNVCVPRAISRQPSGAENAISCPVSSQEASVSRHQFCHPELLLSSTSAPNVCSPNELCRFSKHPDLSILEPGSLACGPVDSAQPSFGKPPNMFNETPIRKIPNLIPPKSQQSCQHIKPIPSSLDLCLFFNVVSDYFP